MLNLIDLIIS